MSALHFEWDERKAAANAKKHGVSFDEAKSAFYDERAKLIDDPDHSGEEDRFVLLGLSSVLRLLVVCHCYPGRLPLLPRRRRCNSNHLRPQGGGQGNEVLLVKVSHAQGI